MDNLALRDLSREVVDETDYHWMRKQAMGREKGAKEQRRFVPFMERENRSDLSVEAIQVISHGKYMTHWKGVEVMKDPIDMIIYQQLLWELRPKTIFEIGTYAGGAALWMSDTLSMYGIETQIYSLDIDLTLLDERAKEQPHVTFVQGDVYQIEEAFPPQWLKNLPHPWLVFEDAHVNLGPVMEYFHHFLQRGDYLIIEDTNPETPAVSGMGLDKSLGYVPFGMGKLNIIKEFMTLYGAGYGVDSYYTDMFGYNGTWHWNSFLRRM